MRWTHRMRSWVAPRARERVRPEEQLPSGTLVYQCNICGTRCAIAVSELHREAGHCCACHATMRSRSVVHHLSTGLFGASLPIAGFPVAARVMKGIGMSDAEDYAPALARHLQYTNTYYHQEPRLDILAPPEAYLGACDFVISSDVFEHVPPPVSAALRNLRRLLKPGGLLVFTVPFAVEGQTREHFPDLHEYSIESREGKPVLVNTTREGHRQEYTDLVFHGGAGATLEMRLFSVASLRSDLEAVGFGNVTVHAEPCFERGIYWSAPWSVPITALAA
ncbi:MAG TPA: methyltransferase domain-containing protein [Casimicrobiaceae bacterium]|nr:methyltransferase domain-containing protein [Casimicrobiaceae bacterium]